MENNCCLTSPLPSTEGEGYFNFLNNPCMSTFDDNLHKKANAKLYDYARELRRNPTPAERLLWEYLKNRQAAGLKFRRQHPLGKFIADFYCHERKLIVELDGTIHDTREQKEADKGRTYELNEMGIKVIRFSNEEVLANIKDVLKKIIEATTAHNPYPSGEGGED